MMITAALRKAAVLLVWALVVLGPGTAFTVPVVHSTSRKMVFRQAWSSLSLSQEEEEEELTSIMKEIKMIAQELWDGDDTTIPVLKSSADDDDNILVVEGEALFDDVVNFSERAEYFRKEALLRGCPKAQHSYGLLLWSGFCAGVTPNAEESAKFHAAAAYQNHLDGMAVLGGCLRTGTGVKQQQQQQQQQQPNNNRELLGERIIDYCASVGNPTGINKKAALFESNGDDVSAARLYKDCYASGRVNALLLFNLGWCYVNGQGVDKKDVDRGISLWKEATEKAPDEGSEEAAWYLSLEYKRDNPKEAKQWSDLAQRLGYRE